MPISMPSRGLQEVCNYIAVAKTKSHSEALRELILTALYTFPKEKTSNVGEVENLLKTMFSIEDPNHLIRELLDQLINEGQIQQPLGTNYVLSPEASSKIKERVDDAFQLQERVKNQWLEEIARQFPELNADFAWDGLHEYLANAFLQHGMQVALFLNPSVEIPTEYGESLSALLNKAVQNKFESTHQKNAKNAISGFFETIGNKPERAKFIAECADGASNFYSLAVSTELAGRFRDKLNPLVLFCDTNFLFGILDLHVHPLADVSNELVNAIVKHELPIKLRYHQNTFAELCSSIDSQGENLRRNKWTRAISRAAIKSRFVSGLEQKYHQKNSETGIEVEEFLKPFKHIDTLLKDRKIDIFRSKGRLQERATLEADYKDFLKSINKEKDHNLIAHDIVVLDCVHLLKKKATSTLDTGALFVTCDYVLYRFDNEICRKKKTPASVVMPNVLFQILRPYIPSSQNFNNSFASTFAIPEFRTIAGGSKETSSKMLSLLNAYDNMTEDVAIRMLTCDMLLDKLWEIKNNKQCKEELDLALAADHQDLIEEVAEVTSEVKQANKKLEEQVLVSELEAAKAQKALESKRESQIAANILAEESTNLKKKNLSQNKIFYSIGAILVNVILYLFIHNIWRWDWLLNHPESYGLQVLIHITVLFGIVGFFVDSWRKVVWSITLIGVALAGVISLLGGPENQ